MTDRAAPGAQDAAADDGKASARPARFETVWETDHRGMNHYQSPSWYRYIGESLGGSFGADWLRFYHPDDRERLNREWQQCLRSEGARAYDVKARIRRHDGEYRWFRIRGVAHRSMDGSVVKWSGTCVDIHDEEMAAAAAPAAPAGARGKAKRMPRGMAFGPLERRLFAIVFVGLLPLALLSFFLVHNNAENQRRQLMETSQYTMRTLMSAVEAEIGGSLAAMDALASSSELDKGNLEEFQAEARQLMRRRPGLVNVVLSTPDARQLMNARLPVGPPLPSRVDPESIATAVATGQPGVGNVVFSPVLQAYAFAVRVPIKRDGRVVYVLTGVIRPESILDLLVRQRIPEHALTSVIDRNYRVVARTRSHGEYVGKSVAPTLRALLEQGHESGQGVTVTLEGKPVYTVYQRSSFSGWTAAYGLPVDIVDAPVTRSYLLLGGALLASALIGLAAALLIARSVTRPMRMLERAASAMAQGEVPAMPDSEFPEIRRVGIALAEAHLEREKLLHREREARLLEQQAREQAEHASRTKDEFLAMLGHELRNPLAAIGSASQILDMADRMRSPDSVEVARSVIRRQVRHLARMTDDLLDAGRVMLGKIALDRRPLNLSAQVGNAIESMQGGGRFDEHTLKVSLADAWVEADPTRLDQIVSNLLGNAVKYTPPGGAISVIVGQEDGAAVLRVRDNGLGLEQDLLPRVFDLFVQGKRSLDRSQGGLGIGLTLVRRLTELHGGSVEARSDGNGKGSEFIVRLPLTGRRAPETLAAEAQSARQQRVVVLVEDNEDVRTSLRHVLELGGHRVHVAADGEEGVELILRTGADIAFVDIGLPKLDGYGVARAVRSRGEARPRLVALTGYGNPADIDSGLAAGFDAYLVKPVDPAMLLDMASTV